MYGAPKYSDAAAVDMYSTRYFSSSLYQLYSPYNVYIV